MAHASGHCTASPRKPGVLEPYRSSSCGRQCSTVCNPRYPPKIMRPFWQSRQPQSIAPHDGTAAGARTCKQSTDCTVLGVAGVAPARVATGQTRPSGTPTTYSGKTARSPTASALKSPSDTSEGKSSTRSGLRVRFADLADEGHTATQELGSSNRDAAPRRRRVLRTFARALTAVCAVALLGAAQHVVSHCQASGQHTTGAKGIKGTKAERRLARLARSKAQGEHRTARKRFQVPIHAEGGALRRMRAPVACCEHAIAASVSAMLRGFRFKVVK
jgi:hypothetical protein